MEPNLFNFNNPHGACPRCTGYGELPKAVRSNQVVLEDSDEDDDLPDTLESETSFVPCPECAGARLNPASRAVSLAGKSLPWVTALSVDNAIPFFETLPSDLSVPDGMEKVRAVLADEI